MELPPLHNLDTVCTWADVFYRLSSVMPWYFFLVSHPRGALMVALDAEVLVRTRSWQARRQVPNAGVPSLCARGGGFVFAERKAVPLARRLSFANFGLTW